MIFNMIFYLIVISSLLTSMTGHFLLVAIGFFVIGVAALVLTMISSDDEFKF